MARMEGKSLVDHHGGKIGVQHRRAQRIFGAADDDRLVDERVVRATHPTPLHADRGPSLDRGAGDDQYLEVRRCAVLPAHGRRQDVGHAARDLAVRIPIRCMLSK